MNENVPQTMRKSQLSLDVRDAYPLDIVPSANQSQYQTVSGLLRILRQRWRLVALTALIVILLGFSVYFLISAYGATTIIEINKDDPSDNDGAGTNGPALTADDIKNEVQTDVNILQTDDSLGIAVIKKLDLLKERSFAKTIDPSERGKPLDEAPRTRDNALALLHARLKVESPTDTRLITIFYKSSDPVLAASITNTLAKQFIEDTLARRQKSILSSSAWLQHELADLKKQVEDSEQKLADYQRSTGLAGIEVIGTANGSGGTTVSVTPQNTVTARLLTLNQELTSAEANRISTEAVNNLVKSNDPEVVLGLGPMSISGGNGGGGSSITPESVAPISALRAQEADLERQLASSTVKYGANNPRLIQLQQQADAVKQQLKAELQRVRERAANDYQYARLNEQAIRSQFKQQENAANELTDKSVKLQLLAQEAFSNQSLYQSLFSKLQTSTIASGTRATRIDIVAEAVPAGLPTIPQRNPFLLAILAVGVFFGVTAAFVRESFDETVRTPQDMADIHGLTLPGYIPRMHSLSSEDSGSGGSQLITTPGSPFSEAFRALRTSIGLVLDMSRPRTMLVTSALGGAGKTTVTFNLGVAFAQQGMRVIMVDADLRNPDLHRHFSTPQTPGLSEACAQSMQTETQGIVQHASLPTLFMLPAGKRPQLPAEVLGSAAFDSLIRRLSSQYDYVLIDSPPILAVTDASIIATKVKAVVAVVRSRSTTRLALSALVQAIERTHAPTFSFVLNDVQNPVLDGFYEYSYSRGKGDQIAANL